VARLAGLPAPVISRAAELLAELEAGGRLLPGSAAPRDGNGHTPALPEELPLAETPAFVAGLAQLDVQRTTPLEALGALERLQAEARAWLQSEQERRETTHGRR
jgi:DNA mismatch repair protein MutS